MQMDLSSLFLFHLGGDKGYLGEPSQKLWYAPYIMHLIERVTTKTFYCEKKAPPP
jgi:hypothetical protein